MKGYLNLGSISSLLLIVFILTNCLGIFESEQKSNEVDGTINNDIWKPRKIIPDSSYIPQSKSELYNRGKVIYESICIDCHQSNGDGVNSWIPPLQNSDYLMDDRERSIKILLFGLTGNIVVKGKSYSGTMPVIEGSDSDIASVLTYIRNNFNNAQDSIISEEVKAVRDKGQYPDQ